MRISKNMEINQINILANYHIDLEFCPRIFQEDANTKNNTNKIGLLMCAKTSY